MRDVSPMCTASQLSGRVSCRGGGGGWEAWFPPPKELVSCVDSPGCCVPQCSNTSVCYLVLIPVYLGYVCVIWC